MTVGSKLERFQKEFPDRVIDVGIAEQHATTLAAGLAIQNMKPYLTIYSTFLQRAYDQIVHDICRQNLNVFIGVDRAGLVGADGDTHQGVFDIAFLRHLPNMVLMMPKDENEARKMVFTAIRYDDGPIAMRFPRGNATGVVVDKEWETIPIGSWEVLRQGTDYCILTFGSTIPMALEAAKKLEKYGIQTMVVNARFIKPLDEKMLTNILEQKMQIITIEEGVLQGGFGSAVLEFANDRGYTNRIIRFGIPDQFIDHGSVQELREEIGLTADNIVRTVRNMIQKLKKRA